MFGFLGTLRGRFFLLTATVAVVLLSAVLYTQNLVQESAAQARTHTEAQHRLRDLITRLETTIHAAEGAIYEYILLQDNELQNGIQQRLTETNDLFSRLTRAINRLDYAEFDEDLADLQTLLAGLSVSTAKVSTIAASPEMRYPGLKILINDMYVSNNNFTQAIESALEESTEFTKYKGQIEVNHLLWQLRYFWSQQISYFRVFIANRSGVFGPPGDSLQHNLTNIFLYFDKVKSLIDQLRVFEQQGLLGLQQSESLELMQVERASYVRSFEKAADIYTSENWRADLPIIRNEIRPLFDDINNLLGFMESRLDTLDSETINRSLRTTRQLSTFIWMLTGFVCALLLLAYLVFEIVIRRPMHRVSRAMDAESKGEPAVNVSSTKYHVVEVKRLLSAFNNMRKQVHSRQKRLESILDNAAEGIVTVDSDGRIEALNFAAEKLFGYREEQIIGKHVRRFISKDSWQELMVSRQKLLRDDPVASTANEIELLGRHRNKREFPMAVKLSKMVIDGRILITGIVADVSERKALFEKLRRMAEHDSLTGLHNRRYFSNELDRAVASAKRGAIKQLAVVYIDLDNFKYVNDVLGHAAGDEVLVEISAKLSKRLRKGDILARLGGDEFAVLLYQTPRQQLGKVAEDFRAQLDDYVFRKEGEAIPIGCSIGVAAFAKDIGDKAELLARADVACNIAKRQGRNRTHVYVDEDMQNRNVTSVDMGWVKRIKEAIAENRLLLLQQPIVAVSTKTVVGNEILLRLLTRDGDLIMPDGFFPAAERFDLATSLDKWVIENVFKMLATQTQTNTDSYCAINLCKESLVSEDVLELITDGIERYNIDATTLVFECEETAVIRDPASASQFLNKLQGFGCKTAIDNFGLGYCSFSYLKDMATDFVKIDASLIRDITSSQLHTTMVRSITDIVHVMGHKIIAECVEDKATLDCLQNIGVDFGQGYYLGRPTNWSRFPIGSRQVYDAEQIR